MLRVKIEKISIHGEIESTINMDSGMPIDFCTLVSDMLSIKVRGLRITACEEKPINGLVRIKLCEVDGAGSIRFYKLCDIGWTRERKDSFYGMIHLFDMTGEGIIISDRFNPHSLTPPRKGMKTFIRFHSGHEIISKINNFVAYKASQPLFWYIDENQLKQLYGLPLYQINEKYRTM